MNENIRSQGENVNLLRLPRAIIFDLLAVPQDLTLSFSGMKMRLLPYGLCFDLTIRIFIELGQMSLMIHYYRQSRIKRPRSVTLISPRKYQLLLNWVSVAILALKQFNTFQSYAGEEIWTSDKRNGTPRYHRVGSVRTVEFLPKHVLAIGSSS